MTKKDLQKVLKEFLLKSKSSLITEETLTQSQLEKRQDYLKDLMKQKSNLVKRYKGEAEKVAYGRATNMAKKAVSEMNKQKLKELVKSSLMKEDNNESSALFNDLEQKLKSHDWYYYMSDDNRSYSKGSAQQSEIRKIIKDLESIGQGQEAKDLYNKYAPYREGGPDLRMKEDKKSFPDLTGDGKVTKADILKGRGIDLDEDIDLGHQDNEPHMVKAELYQIGKYAMELYSWLEEIEETGGEYDFPAWWQAKITTAKENISGAKHYLEFELQEPKIDATVDAMTGEEPHEGEPMMEDKGDKHVVMKGNKFYTGTEFVDDIKNAMRYNLDSATMVAKREKGMVYTPSKMNENSDEETLAAKIAKALKDKANKDASDQSNLKQARTALNKGNIDVAKKIADPYLEEKKLTKAEKEKKEDIVKGMKGNFKGDKAAMYAIATSKAKKVAENLKTQLKEYDDPNFSGQKLISNTSTPTDINIFKKFFPTGVASMGNAKKSLLAHDRSGIKDRMGRLAPMFVHVQYHDFEDMNGEKYRAHQTQYYNSNYDKQDPTFNPKVTKLSLMKLGNTPEEKTNLGSILVKTEDYIKDLKNLNITNRAM